jgi:hypothetical protein
MQCSMQVRGEGWQPNMTRVMFSLGGRTNQVPILIGMSSCTVSVSLFIHLKFYIVLRRLCFVFIPMFLSFAGGALG